MEHRNYKGKVSYIHDEIGERGREWFDVTIQKDGTRTLRSKCEMDDSQVLRDVTLTVDKNWMPKDSFVRLTVKGEFFGSAWFLFENDMVSCEAKTKNEGRVSQKVKISKPIRSFGPHPVVCDIWHLGTWDWKSEEYIQSWQSIMSSPLPNGASGPMIGISDFMAKYEGEELIETPCGNFKSKHFVFPLERKNKPDEHVWYTGKDLLLTKIRWDLLKTTYILSEVSGDYN